MVAKQRENSATSLTAELLQKISPMLYKTYVAKLNEVDAVTGENFKNSKWANYFTVDSMNIVRNGWANANHVFNLFGAYSGHTGTEVRVNLLKNIASDLEFYKRWCTVCLQMCSITFEKWVELIAYKRVFCDKLALMGLCNLYRRHCVVLTHNKLWSTIQADTPLNLLDLLKECSVHLIYLGNLCFGVLTWRPRLPKKVASKSPGFNIIEEYTLDEPNVTTNPDKNLAKDETENTGNVETGIGNIAEAIMSETVSTGSAMEPNQTSPDVVVNQCAETLHVATRTTNPTAPKTDPDQNTVTTLPPAKTTETKVLQVTCPEDGIILSQYPWKPKLAICMDCTPPVDIDIWCNKVQNYYVFTPPPQPTLLWLSVMLKAMVFGNTQLRRNPPQKSSYKLKQLPLNSW